MTTIKSIVNRAMSSTVSSQKRKKEGLLDGAKDDSLSKKSQGRLTARSYRWEVFDH